MNKLIYTLIFGIFASFSLLAQGEIELGECDQEPNEKIEKQINKALVSLRKKDLKMARIYINNALKIDDQNAHGLYLMGELALREKNVKRAEQYWTQLIEICPNYRAEVQFFLGVIFVEKGEKAKSKEMLNLFLKNPERDRIYDREAKFIIEEIDLQENMKANPVPFNPNPVSNICTPADEYLAIISPDEEYSFFTRRSKKQSNKYDGPATTTRIVEEFCMAQKTEYGTFEEGAPLDYPFNENYNEGGPTITANNRELYFTVCEMNKEGRENCDIYYCKKVGSYWGEIEKIEVINSEYWESQPSISSDGQYLYFVSNRPGGIGGLDLYVSQRKLNGDWDAPKNLGKTINTRKNEKSPFIHSDSQTFYFASNGQPTMGGYDIYYSKKNEDETYSKPTNIGYPINTKADEIALFVSLNGQRAFFSSNKLKGPGGWDFYEFDLHAAARPEQVALVKGTLLDENNQVVEGAELTIKNLKTKDVKVIEVDEFTGEYASVVLMKEKEHLILKVEKEGAAFNSKLVDLEESEAENGVVETEFEVAPIEVGKEYRLNDIKFGTDSYELSEKAKLVIEEFILFLHDQPRMKVDIQGHTDNVGNASANLSLSKNRAKVVYDYLIKKGISASRLKWHGFGQTMPISPNSTEKERAQNRRTVFVIMAR